MSGGSYDDPAYSKCIGCSSSLDAGDSNFCSRCQPTLSIDEILQLGPPCEKCGSRQHRGDGSERVSYLLCPMCRAAVVVPVISEDKLPAVESINLSWYDGPVHDAAVIDLGEDRPLYSRFLIELRVDVEIGCWGKPQDPNAVYTRFSIDELEAMVDLYRKYVPKGSPIAPGRPLPEE